MTSLTASFTASFTAALRLIVTTYIRPSGASCGHMSTRQKQDRYFEKSRNEARDITQIGNQ